MLLFWCLSFSLADDFPRGQIVPHVACLKNPRIHYTLFLPSRYDHERKWPVFFVFCPDARGIVPVKLLKNAAELYGYILIGSNTVRNAVDVSEDLNSLLEDAPVRFSIDPERNYAAGFSGGARIALWMILNKDLESRRFVGVISCGAFYPLQPDLTLKKMRESGLHARLAVFGLVGNSCMNFKEMSEANEGLDRLGMTHWLEEFSGGHQWPSAELMKEAVEFMEVDAIRRGFIPDASGFLEKLAQARLRSACSLEGRDWHAAWRKYDQISKFFVGLKDAQIAEEKASALAKKFPNWFKKIH